jgi:cathepsin B
MFKLVFVGTVMAVAMAEHPINQNIIDEIKAKATWVPLELHENPLAAKSEEFIQGLLGLHLGQEENDSYEYLSPTILKAVPDAFDARQEWPTCVHAIRDQQSCGSCWAFAGSEAMSDRVCIASGGAENFVLSPEDFVECNTANMGCNGGYLGVTWKYLESTGIVTDSCLPYTSGNGKSGACPTSCSNSEAWVKHMCQAGTITKSTTVAEIKNDIYAHGPVETGFTVYGDFMNYKSGVYYHVSGLMKGGHAVKILGWGNAEGMDYWLCANSWNTSWGEDGFFRIKQGDCGIDAATYGCIPKTGSAYF